MKLNKNIIFILFISIASLFAGCSPKETPIEQQYNNISQIPTPNTQINTISISQTITLRELINLLHTKIENSSSVKYKFLDDEYELYELSEIKEELNSIKHKPYTAFSYDCDDFAFNSMLKLKNKLDSVTIGYLEVEYLKNNTITRHAINILVDINYDIYIYEPYYNILILLEDSEYKIMEIII
jgi:hypothetical protein